MLRKNQVQVILFCLFSAFPFVQNAQVSQGQFLKSSGTIPEDFLESWANKYEKSLSHSLASGEDEDDLEDFWLSQHHHIDELLQSGRYTFGDPMTNYLNEIADHLLRNDPELKAKIRIYSFRSPSVNAFTLADGIIAIHTGLVAHAKSEAELAFVIAHEISHYTRNHFYASFKANRDATENSWSNPSLSPLAQAENRIGRSKENEIEADQYGLDLYLKSDYALNAVDSVLTTLHRSYIPFGRENVSSNPFCLKAGCFQIPNVFYREDLSPISLSEDYADDRHSHPNIGSRRNAIHASLVQRDIKEGTFYVVGETKFHQIQELARFEMVREKILNANYAEVLYDIYVLEKIYPESKFLAISKVKALYGLASFKAVDEISLVTPSTSRIEGPAQQVIHLIKQMNRSQLVSIALQASRSAEKLYPEESYLKRYSSELAKYLLVYCDENPDDFKVEGNALPEFTQAESEFRSPRAYLRAQQSHYKEFYRYLVKEDVDKGWLAAEMHKHEAFRDSIKAEKMMTVEAREERKEEQWERLEEFGSNLNVKNLVVLDPIIRVLNIEDDLDERLEGLEQEREYKENLPAWIQEAGITAELLYTEHMKPTDLDSYNEFCQLEEWVYEARLYRQFGLMPVSIDIREKLPADTRYVCRIIGVVDKDDWDSYYFGLFDLKRGKIVYQRYETVGRNLSMGDLEKQTKTDLEIIAN
ncbi:M48 family metallopeptidase [Croceimicrobium sp.]|uniref:M48 family metallopeptidase n=1 Tax=Croceimicrobium sp. TaxID=2828340 RepID=UPI003BACC530